MKPPQSSTYKCPHTSLLACVCGVCSHVFCMREYRGAWSSNIEQERDSVFFFSLNL